MTLESVLAIIAVLALALSPPPFVPPPLPECPFHRLPLASATRSRCTLTAQGLRGTRIDGERRLDNAPSFLFSPFPYFENCEARWEARKKRSPLSVALAPRTPPMSSVLFLSFHLS
ncbi:hypothetical protein C8J57DRAFT_1503404 [Mycena rebaudengoi]|nr:hypothetical protein C8J57DRAFT_1503404 [Mycena rebaudengoi]